MGRVVGFRKLAVDVGRDVGDERLEGEADTRGSLLDALQVGVERARGGGAHGDARGRKGGREG